MKTNRPGWQSTEFWLTVIAILLLFLGNAFEVKMDPELKYALLGLVGAYSIGRSLAKRNGGNNNEKSNH